MSHRALRLAIAAIAPLVPAMSAVAQGSRPTVAVMPFNAEVPRQDASAYAGLDKAIADVLARDVGANPNLIVVERAVVQRAIDARRRPAGSRLTPEAAMAAGRTVGARKIVVGRFQPDAGGNLRIDARTVDVASGEVELTERVQDKADNFLALIGRLADRLSTSLDASAAPRAAAAGPSSALSLSAALTYGRALDAADHGERGRAIDLFGAVLQDFPNYEPAKRELAKLTPDA